MSMTVLPDQPASKGPKQAKAPRAPRAPKAPKGPRQRPRLDVKREHLAAVVALVVLAAGGFLFWQHEQGGGATPPRATAATQPPIPVYTAKAVGATVRVPKVSPRVFLAHSIRLARMSRGFEATITQIVGGQTITGRQVSGRTSGQQAFVVGDQSFEARVVGATTYLRGTVAMLHAVGQMPLAAADLVGTRWVALHRGDRPYRSVTAGILVKSSAAELALDGPLR